MTTTGSRYSDLKYRDYYAKRETILLILGCGSRCQFLREKNNNQPNLGRPVIAVPGLRPRRKIKMQPRKCSATLKYILISYDFVIYVTIYTIYTKYMF